MPQSRNRLAPGARQLCRCNMFKHFPPVSANRVAVLLLAGVCASALGMAVPAHGQDYPDYYNEWDIPYLDPDTNTVGPNGLEFDFDGDATGCLPAQVVQDTQTNAFAAYQAWPYGGTPANPDTITFDGSVTRVLLSGGNLPVPPPLDTGHGGTFPGPTWGNAAGLSYHDGLNAGIPTYCSNAHPFLGKQWIWDAGNGFRQSAPIAVVSTQWLGIMTKKNINESQSAVLYAEIKNPVYTGTWYHMAYVAPKNGKSPTFQIKNNGVAPITLGSVGLVIGLPRPKDPRCQTDPTCPEIQASLDTLNNTYFPVPGQPNSPFTPLPKLNGLTLKPGHSVKIIQP